MYDKLIEEDPLIWTEQDENKLSELKSRLISAPVLRLPSLDKPFELYVNAESGIAYGVVAQDWGGIKKPVVFISKLLDPVTRGWLTCVQAIAATSILVEESHRLTFGGKLIVHTPHAVRNVVNQKASKWLTDARMLKYEAVLVHTDNN